MSGEVARVKHLFVRTKNPRTWVLSKTPSLQMVVKHFPMFGHPKGGKVFLGKPYRKTIGARSGTHPVWWTWWTPQENPLKRIELLSETLPRCVWKPRIVPNHSLPFAPASLRFLYSVTPALSPTHLKGRHVKSMSKVHADRTTSGMIKWTWNFGQQKRNAKSSRENWVYP